MTTTPEQHLEDAAQHLPEVGRVQAQSDARDFLDPQSPSPTPGEHAVATEIDASRSQLRTTQRTELEVLSGRLSTLERYEEEHRAGTLQAPDAFPRRRFIPWELAPLGAGVVAEFFALRPPIETMLRFDSGSLEGMGIAAVIVGVAAFCGHLSGDALAEMEQAETAAAPGWRSERDRHVQRARILGIGIVLVAVLAVVARVVTATLDASIDGATSFDPAEVFAFTLFQAVFALLAVAVGWSIARRRRAADRRRDDAFAGEVADEKATVQKRIDGAPGRHAEQAEHHEQIGATAIGTYRSTLIHLCEDAGARVEWADRFATKPWDGWRRQDTDCETLVGGLATPGSADPGHGKDADGVADGSDVLVDLAGDEPEVRVGGRAAGADPHTDDAPIGHGRIEAQAAGLVDGDGRDDETAALAPFDNGHGEERDDLAGHHDGADPDDLFDAVFD